MSDPTNEHDGQIENPFAETQPLSPEDALRKAVRAAIKDGELSKESTADLQTLRESLGLSLDDAKRIFDDELKKKRKSASLTAKQVNSFDASCWMMVVMFFVFVGVFYFAAGEHIKEFNVMLGSILGFIFSKTGVVALAIAAIAIVFLGGC